MISGFFVFFLIYSSLVGVGALSFQNIIFEFAENDAWISVLLMGVSLHVIIWMIFKMLGNPAKDVIDLHRILLGKYVGNAVSLLMVAYYFIMALALFRSYIEIIQVWMFPTLQTWILSFLLISIIFYIVSGGFRVLVGYCFFGVILSTLLPLFMYFNFKYGHLDNLMPIFNHSLSDFLSSFRYAGIMFMGFDTLLIYFPFIKSPEKNRKWAQLGLFVTTCKYTILSIVTIMYYSQGLLKHTYWPTLVMIKVIEFSLIARVEFIFVSVWLLIIIPTLCLSIWSCTRIMKRVTHLKPTYSLLLILIVLFIASLLFNDRVKINWLGMHVAEICFYFIYAYIPLLFILYLFRHKTVHN
ncbi:GerAB/ArcD/ProY family transporter [Paenibacillus qinlingensis]|nr:GerAB/ArcD/ProY family transporter [Paenibacillus qinlingensis]